MHWYVNKDLFGVSKTVVEHIRKTYLGNDKIFKDFSNNRALKVNDVLSFYMVDMTYDAIKGQEEQAPMFVKRAPASEEIPDWSSQVLMATTSHSNQSMVIEVFEDHFLIKKLDGDPKRVDRALGSRVYAQGNYIFGIEGDHLAKVALSGDNKYDKITLKTKDVAFFVSSYHTDERPG